MQKYLTPLLLILLSLLFTYLEGWRPDPDEAEFWEYMARFTLFAGLLKAFLIKEDEEYSRTLSCVRRHINEVRRDIDEFRQEFQEYRDSTTDTSETP